MRPTHAVPATAVEPPAEDEPTEEEEIELKDERTAWERWWDRKESEWRRPAARLRVDGLLLVALAALAAWQALGRGGVEAAAYWVAASVLLTGSHIVDAARHLLNASPWGRDAK